MHSFFWGEGCSIVKTGHVCGVIIGTSVRVPKHGNAHVRVGNLCLPVSLFFCVSVSVFSFVSVSLSVTSGSSFSTILGRGGVTFLA